MKQNDFLALNLNLENTGINLNDLRSYGITPDNTGLEDIDYYKNIPQVVDRFSKDGKFDDTAYTDFYKSVKKAYSTYAADDYLENLIQSVPSSASDIFSLGNTNITNDTAYMVRSRDPQRKQVGIGNLFQEGPASFSEREVAQANKVLDENGKQLDWSPNDRGGIRALFRPALALAEWKEGETSIENGIEVVHHAGERKYDDNGDPMYQMLGKNEVYGKQVLHFSDTLTKEGTFWNKLDIFDSDGVDTSIAKTIGKIAINVGAFMSPAGPYLGALEAARALSVTIPAVTKAVNGAITNNNDNNLGRKMTSWENWARQFDRSVSDKGSAGFWTWENIGNQIIDSTKQLYSQGLIQKIPYLLSAHPSIKSQKLGQLASTLYMATTSADDVYGEYKRAGVNDRFAGIGALATMGAFFGFMNNEYFKEYLFSDPTLELPGLRKALKGNAKVTAEAYKKTVETNVAKAFGAKFAEEELPKVAQGNKWFNKIYNGTTGILKKISKSGIVENPYLVRGFNEGLEEVMEELATDLVKGTTLGLQELGFNVKDSSANNVDFGYSVEDFLQRYATSFVGGVFGGTIFEGLTQWNNRNIKSISKLDLDEQLAWYIRNGYRDEIDSWINRWEKKGKFGSKNLSMKYSIEQDGDSKTAVWDPASDKNVDQNTGIANLLRQRVSAIDAQLAALGPTMLSSNNEILQKALIDIADEAEKAGMSLSEYSQKNLRDARIDFIKQTKVDQLIISDAADFQHQIMVQNDKIQKRKEYLAGNSDNANRNAEDVIKNDETLKIYEKNLNEAKNALKELLSGKRAYEYLRLGLFAGDSDLKRLYLSDRTDENGKPTYFEDVKGWTRAIYNQSYDDLIRNSGEKDPNRENQTELEEYLNSQFNAWRDATEDIRKIRGAYELHKELSKIVDPIIQRQISDYTGYKRDADRTGELTVYNLNVDEVLTELATAQNELATYMQENPGIDYDTDEEYQRLYAKFRDASIKYRFFTPQRILDEAFNSESTVPVTLEEKTTGGITDALQFLKNYYLDLNRKKIVSEFSDDMLERGVFNMIDNMVMLDDSETQIPINLEIARRDLLLEANDVDEILEIVASNYSDDEEILEKVESLKTLANNFKNEKIAVDGSGVTLAQNVLDYLGDVLTQPQREILEKKLKVATFANNLLAHINDDALVYNKFKKSTEEGLEAYRSLKETISNLEGSDVIEDIDVWLDHVLFDNSDFINSINDILQVKSEGIKTPILDWIQGFSTKINGIELPLWDLLQREMKNLISKTEVNEYVIDNPDSVKELQFLQAALNSAAAVLQGARQNGVNHYVNLLKESDKLPEIEIPELFDVYDHDLNVLYARLSSLIDLHLRNHKSTIAIKKESFIKNSPKFLKAIVDQTTSEDTLLQKKFKDIFGIDLTAEWDTINDNRFDLEEIDETNFEDFWKAFRQWMDRVHSLANEINLEEGIQKAKNIYGRDIETRDNLIGFVLCSSFTDLWKFQNSEITNKDDEKVQNLEIVTFLASIMGFDPKLTFSAMQGVSEEEGKKPFWDQMLSIVAGFSQTRNRSLFNSIVDEIYLQGKIEIENNNEISEANKKYLLDRSVIYNAVFIDGASGTGKSKIVLKFIKQMNSKFAFTKADGTNATVKSLAIAKYDTRAKALGNILSLTGENVMTLDAFVSKHFRVITDDDYEPIPSDEGYRRRIKKEVIGELHTKLLEKNTLMENTDVLNIYVDEIGLMSEAELQLLSAFSKLGYINLIFAGDRMQRGFTTEYDGKPVNSGITDVWMLSTPRLTTSVRANNYGMQKSLEDLETRLKILWSKWQEQPWISGSKLQLDGVEEYKPIFSQSNSNIYGIGIVDSGDSAMSTLSQFEGTIGIITDHEDDYTKYASDKILVKNPDDVQGDEFDYVLIDITNLPNLSTFDRLRYEYTLISRARNGVLIVNSLGDIKSDIVRADAASEVNHRDEDGEIVSDELDQYKDWWDSLFSNDVLGTSTTPEESPEESNPAGLPPPTSAPGTAGRGSVSPGSVPIAAPAQVFNFENFDEEDFKRQVREKGPEATNDNAFKFYSKTQQRTNDLENYQKYYKLLAERGNTGDLIDVKGFIDWLFSPDTISFFTDPANKYSILSKLNPTPEFAIKYLEIVRNFALDYLSLSEEDLKQKYSTDDTLGLKGLINDNIWHDFVDALYAEVQQNGKSLLYTVKDGNKQFVYFIVPQLQNEGIKYYALPITVINNGNLPKWVTLATHQEIPTVMLSSGGYKTKTLKEVAGNYVSVSSNGYIPKAVPDQNDLAPNEKGKDAGKFARRNLGQAFVIISSIFNNPKAAAEKLLAPETDKDGKIVHMDRTSLNSSERLMAVNRRFNAEQYYNHAKALQKLWRGGEFTQEDEELLNEFINKTERGRIYQAKYSDEDKIGIRAFRKLQLLSNGARNNFTTAIIRWFWQNRAKKAQYDKFMDNFTKYASDVEYMNHTGKIIQHGISFTIYNDLGLPDQYYIFLNDDKTSYTVVNGKNKDICTLSIDEYFNQGENGTDLIRIAKNIINKIDPTKQKYNYNDSSIASSIQRGDISFGFTTKSTEDDSVAFYAPFDSEMVPFIEDVYTDSEFEKFLQNDSVFKYGFLIGFAGTNEGFDNDYWLYCDLAGESTDIIEIIPPTFLIDSFTEVYRGSLPSLNSLDHKLETMNKSEVVVKKHLDINNNPVKWVFATKFSTTISQLQSELGLSSIPGNENTNVIGIENNNLIIEDDSGRRYEIPITEDQINSLLSEMQIVEVKPNVKYVDESGNANIIVEGNEYKLQLDDVIDNATIVFFKDGNLVVRFGNQILKFTGISDTFFDELNKNWVNNNSDDFYYYGSTDTVDVYYDSKSSDIKVISNGVVITGKVVNISNMNDVIIVNYVDSRGNPSDLVISSINEELYNKFKPLLATVTVASPVEVAKKTFKDLNLSKTIISDPLLNDDPNAWAIKYMQKLKGYYTWDSSKGKFKSTKENQTIYNFAFSGNLPLNDVLSNLNNIEITDDSFIITINNERKVYTYSVNRRGKYTFTPYESSAQTKLNAIRDFLNSIPNAEDRDILLWNIRIQKQDENAFYQLGRVQRWISNNKDKIDLINRSVELAEDLTIDEICNL